MEIDAKSAGSGLISVFPGSLYEARKISFSDGPGEAVDVVGVDYNGFCFRTVFETAGGCFFGRRGLDGRRRWVGMGRITHR